jgi:hypothetical protein
MEPLRPVVDGNTLQFALSHVFTPGDFTINRTGECRLNPQMAKQSVKQTAAFASVSALVNEALVRLRWLKSAMGGRPTFGRAYAPETYDFYISSPLGSSRIPMARKPIFCI